MIFKKKKFFLKSLRVLYQNEDLGALLCKDKYDYVTIISHKDLGLEKSGFHVKHKKLANIALDGTVDEVLHRFSRSTRQEIQQTYDISGLEFRVEDPEMEKTYELYKKFEVAQDRVPWGVDTFEGVINFNAYHKDELIASVPCYDIFPYLQVRAMFSKRMGVHGEDAGFYKLIGSATRRLIFEICRYAHKRGCKFVGLGSVNYSDPQKARVADFKMFFGSHLGDEYTYVYKSRWFAFMEKLKLILTGNMAGK